MNHINVCSVSDTGIKQIDAAVAINRMTTLSLLSVIGAYRGQDFGLDTLSNTVKGFRKFNDDITKILDAKLYVDSGGYSIITGEVEPYLIKRCIETYSHCLEYCSDVYDYIFSLDIPFNIKHPYFNTCENIEKHNKSSMFQSIEIINRNPLLADKFIFIYHFKTVEHYEIWKKMYNELDIGSVIKHRAIGGMVSLKKIAMIDFSPFIATAYQCLNDYKRSNTFGEEFRLHFLGINVAYDRFIIAFIERLFKKYLGNNINVVFTYDTINYRISGFHIKKMHILISDKLISYELNSIPDEILFNIYKNKKIVKDVKKEIKIKCKTGKFENGSIITPLKVFSELSMDRFFEYQIDEKSLINITIDSNDFDEFDKIIEPVKEIFSGYESIFKANTVKSILKSLDKVQDFHYWYTNTNDDEYKLDILSRKFISKIHLGRMLDDPEPKKSK